ncbi:MAG: BNR-4 repeat-containing protein [Candidatus Hydrogenedentota bacterium]
MQHSTGPYDRIPTREPAALAVSRAWVALAALAVLSVSSASAANMVYFFADNGFGNPVSTLQHPCAEHHNGVTYIAYQGPLEDAYICAYNHQSGEWQGPVKAGDSLMGKQQPARIPGDIDNHGRPALMVDCEGYIHIVFGGHGGYPKFGRNEFGMWGDGRQTHVVSRHPEDISDWERRDNVSPFGTYSQFVHMDDGDIYLFYRHGSHQSDWVYQKSRDNGRTFHPPVSILKHKVREEDSNLHDAWYAWFDKGSGDTITASYVYHPCKTRGHDNARHNGYYMLMDCADDTWHNVRGRELAAPVTKESADKYTLVSNTGDMRSKRGTCRVDANGHPHVTFKQGGYVRYYRWLGNEWQQAVCVTPEPGTGECDLHVESPRAVWLVLARKAAGTGEICWWKTTDGGLTWNKDRCLLNKPGPGFRIGALVRNAHPDARVVASRQMQHHGGLYSELYLLGRNGPIRRRGREAAVLARHLAGLFGTTVTGNLGHD